MDSKTLNKMGIYYDSKILGIRILRRVDYACIDEIEECIGDGCLELLEKYKNISDVEIQALYSFTSTLERTPISRTKWVPLHSANKNEILNNRNGI